MCQSPILISNNSNFINPLHFDVQRSVPCGKCVECQHNKQIEYAIRGYYEFKECLDHGGFVYFDTLTYNDAHLPRFYGVPCFSRLDVQKYMKRLRRKLELYYDIPEKALRYLVTCEYGAERKRVHYHVIFFVHSNKIDYVRFHRLMYQTWRNCWKYVHDRTPKGKLRFHRDGTPIMKRVPDIRGNTDLKHGKNPSKGVLTSNAAITYTTKYIAKEDSYVMTLAAELNNMFRERFDFELSPDVFKEFFQPWHLQSMGFGSYLETRPDQKQYIEDLSVVMPNLENGLTVSKKYALPGYFIKRLYYEPVGLPDGRWMLIRTKEYCDILYRKEMERYDDFVRHTTAQIRSIDNLYNLLKNGSRKEDFSRCFLKVEDFKNRYKSDAGSLAGSIESCLGSHGVDAYCTFARYFLNWYTIDRPESLDAKYVAYHRIYDLGYNENPLKSSKRFRRDYRRLVKWRNDKYFSNFYDLYSLLSEMMVCFAAYSLDREEEKREDRRNLRALKFKT